MGGLFLFRLRRYRRKEQPRYGKQLPGAVFLFHVFTIPKQLKSPFSGQIRTMKYATLLLLFFGSLTAVQAQEVRTPKISIKWAPTGLIAGSLSLQGEYSFSPKRSLTARIGLPVSTSYTFQYEEKDAKFDTKAISFLAGYRVYLSKKQLSGFYLEPYFKYVHHTSEGIGNGTLDSEPVTMSFSNAYSGAGVGAQLGVQFLIRKRFVIDLFFLGPEINSSTNKFRAVEISSTLAWDAVEAGEAERDIRNFIDEFPFIRNKTNVMVDRGNRTVSAEFRGVLPGVRTGISFGVAL